MNTCVLCGAPLPSRLDTYGDLDAPMCLSCHLTPAPLALEIYRHEYDLVSSSWTVKRGRDFDKFFGVEQ